MFITRRLLCSPNRYELFAKAAIAAHEVDPNAINKHAELWQSYDGPQRTKYVPLCDRSIVSLSNPVPENLVKGGIACKFCQVVVQSIKQLNVTPVSPESKQ